MNAQAELRARLRNAATTREIYAPGKPVNPAMALMARHYWANGPYQFGILRAVLGEFEAARTEFAESARLYSDLIAAHPEDGTGRLMSLYSAVLAGDQTAARRFADHWTSLPVPANVVRDAAPYQRALPLLLAGRDAEARPAIEEMKAVDPRKAVYRGAGALMGAILDSDTAGYASALDEVLKSHHASACRKGSHSWNSLGSFLCVEATALAIAAAWRGLPPPSDLPSRRATLKNLLVIGLTEFEGRPLEKGTTYDLAVDYLPSALVPA